MCFYLLRPRLHGRCYGSYGLHPYRRRAHPFFRGNLTPESCILMELRLNFNRPRVAEENQLPLLGAA
eukprot:459524-Pyramimonas_sp.AAC.1